MQSSDSAWGRTTWTAGGLDDVLVSGPALLQVSGQTPVVLLSFYHLHAVVQLQLTHLASQALQLVDTGHTSSY